MSHHVVGEDLKALPDRLDIRFFSFAENKLYHGSFDLPYESILELFRAGVANPKERALFDTIMVGVAPGGAVAVWASGREQREVFFGQAEAYEGVLTNSLNSVVEDRAGFVRRVLEYELTAEMLADLHKNGVPLGQWDRFRKRYRWLPSFAQPQRPDYVRVSFFNGERYRFNFPLSPSMEGQSHPVPMLLSFTYLMPGETARDSFTVRFDATEIYAAFDKLGADQQAVFIESAPALPKQMTRVRLYNARESIELERLTIDDW